jgi:membrane-bound metal-dependent hydrolase YbcI (DUF457 family)
MTGRTHRIIGGSTAFVVSTVAGLPAPLIAGAVAVAAKSSSLPDDAEKWLRVPHRRLTHWPLVQMAIFAIPVAASAIWIPIYASAIGALCASAFFGCFMHSIADSMTIHPSGIQLLWPISRRGYHLMPQSMRVRVDRDSLSEKVFRVMLIVIVLCFTYVRYHDKIPN